MARPTRPRPIHLLTPPYERLVPIETGELPSYRPGPGEAVVWELAAGDWGTCFRAVRDRAPGLALILILPPTDELHAVPRLMDVISVCRPHSILPYHAEPSRDDLVTVLRRPPEDLPIEITDYLFWRGLRLDGHTRHLVRRTIELGEELRTISALARALYVSRRALGRRFLARHLPVPSHWLHFSRVIRAAVRLQNSDDSLFRIGCDLGYTDGFALSNQMKRLTGIRPSTARECLGWEWIVEAWLRTESAAGSLGAPGIGRESRSEPEPAPPSRPLGPRGPARTRRSGTPVPR